MVKIFVVKPVEMTLLDSLLTTFTLKFVLNTQETLTTSKPLTSINSLFSIGISNQVTWAPADVASQVVLAKSSVVTRMLLAFIDICKTENKTSCA